MNESIKFINDAANGKYAENDTGVVVSFSRDYTDRLVAVVRLSDDSYTTAPLADIEYAGE